MRLENKTNKAWDLLDAGDIESAYKILAGSRLTSREKEIIRQANFLKAYDYPELINVKDKTRHEFALVACWNFLIKYNNIDNFAPLLGNTFEFSGDINAIREVLGYPPLIFTPFIQEQYPELLTLLNLSLFARDLFIHTIKYAQIRLGGLVDTRVIENLDSHRTKQAFVDLAQAGLIKTDLAINELLPDLMMTKTMKELKQFAFDHGLTFHGTKYQLIQSIISAIDPTTIKKRLNLQDETSFIYPLASNLSSLKDHVWIESAIFEHYVQWIYQTKCLNKSEQVILDERIERLNKNHYDPMEPWMPSLKDKNIHTTDQIWKSKNMLLLKSIWDSGCDLILKDVVQRYAWDWRINIEEAIKNYFTGDKLPIYEKACSQNIHLRRFCERRLDELSIEVRKPKLITCAGCGIDFMDWSIDDRLSKRVGYKICFCQDCYYSAFSYMGTGNQLVDEKEMLKQISIVADILGVVPTSSFRRNLNLATISEASQIVLIKTLLSMPLQKKFVDTFGSWLQALVLAGVLDDGTQQTSRGVRCIAIDGHVCNSLSEKTIDDWLHSHNIHHEKEPHYPYHFRLNPYKLRADWKVQDILIEYAGLMDEPDYAAKMKAKREIANEFGLSLIILEPKDILDLDLKLATLKGL